MNAKGNSVEPGTGPEARESVVEAYVNRRMAALLGLGFAAGLPSVYKLLGSTLDAWLGSIDADLTTIGLFALATLPLAFNFVWAPLLDSVPPPLTAGMGRRRGWLIWIQLALMVAIAAMALVGPTSADDWLGPLAVAALAVAFLVATQDVAADAYRTEVLPDAELGAGAAVYVNGYRLGMLAAGGGAMLLADYLGWRVVYGVLAALMGVGLLATWLAPVEPQVERPASLEDAVVKPFGAFVRQRGLAGTLALLALVVAFKLPDAMANKMVVPLLQKELEFDLSEIAIYREWLGLGVLVIGTLVGGAILAKMRLAPALGWLLALQAISNFGWWVLAGAGPRVDVLIAVVAVENFCAGLVTAGFVALLMSQCQRRYAGTQYALLTSLMFGSGMMIASGTGWLTERVGYEMFFMLSVVVAAPAAVILWLAPPRDHRDDR